MKREPLLIVAAAVVLLAVGVDLSGLADNVERIVNAVAIVGGLAVARRRVWPEEHLERERSAAYVRGRRDAEQHGAAEVSDEL